MITNHFSKFNNLQYLGIDYLEAYEIIESFINEKYNINSLDICFFMEEVIDTKCHPIYQNFCEDADIFQIKKNNLSINKIIDIRKEILPIFIKKYIDKIEELKKYKYINVMFYENFIFDYIKNNNFYYYYVYESSKEIFIGNLLLPAILSDLPISIHDCSTTAYGMFRILEGTEEELVLMYCIDEYNKPIIYSNSYIVNNFIKNMREINSAQDFYIEYNYYINNYNINDNIDRQNYNIYQDTIYPMFLIKDNNIITYSNIFNENFNNFNFDELQIIDLFRYNNYKLYTDRFI